MFGTGVEGRSIAVGLNSGSHYGGKSERDPQYNLNHNTGTRISMNVKKDPNMTDPLLM